MDMKQATEAIYTSLDNDNEDINTHITNLKTAMRENGTSVATFDPNRLSQNNRQGRKTMMAYFKKHGVKIGFEG
jgi:hypothetical protein